MLNRILTFLYHFSWYALAFVILTAAVLATAVRLALPEIGKYNEEIQSWVSQQMEYPVVINNISAEWRGWTPNLYLNNIDLYTQDNKNIITKLNSAHIGIDLLASIWSRNIVPNYLSVAGLDFDITRHLDGSISIASDDTENLNNSSTKNTALSGWLLQQNHIILESATVSWNDEKYPGKRKQFSNVWIQLKTDEQRLQLEANTTLPKQLGQTLNIKADITGNILTSDWNGLIYAEATQLKPTDLLDRFLVKSVGGNADIKLWTNWQRSRLIDFNGEANYADFSLQTNNAKLPINNISLTLLGKRQQKHDWLLNINIADLHTADKLWPASNHQILIERGTKNNRYDAYFSYINARDVIPLLLATDIVPGKFRTKLKQHTVNGELTNVRVSYDPTADIKSIIQLDTEFKNLELTTPDNTNTISGLDGTLNTDGTKTKLQLNSELVEIKLGTIFEHAYSFSGINTNIELLNTDSAELIINDLEAITQQFKLNASGKIRFDEYSPYVDIVAHMDETDIEIMADFVPKQTGPILTAWFKRGALAGGKILSTDLIFHGYLADYPFHNAEGHFKTIMNIENVTLEYNEKWPAVDNLTAELVLENDTLTMPSATGYIFDAKINELRGEIKDLSKDDHLLHMVGSLNGHTSDARNFIAQSPINENKPLRESMDNIAGNFALDLTMDIPLGPEKTKLNGQATFTDTTFESDMPGLALEDVDGTVHFTRDELWATDVNALFNGLPTKLNIPKLSEDNPYSENYVLSMFADKAFLINQVGTFFPSFREVGKTISNYFDGASTWTVSIKKPESGNTKQIELSSDLNGVHINLPYPFGKQKEDSKPFTVTTSLSDVAISKINLNLDNLLFTDLIVDNSKDVMVENVLVGLGQRHSATDINSDISVEGKLTKFNLSEWLEIFNPDSLSTSPTNNNSTKQRKVAGTFNIESLQLFENEFNNVDVSISNPTEGWVFAFAGEEINGDTQFIKNDKENKIRVNLQSLSLQGTEKDEDTEKTDINKIPDLDINIDQFSYKNNLLGKFNLQTSHIENGILIDTLSISKAGFSINANGTWTRNEDIDHSDFYAKLESDSIENMLSTFDYKSANIKDGQTTIEMKANWMDTPMNFAMEKINGSLNMKIDKGQFLDIDPKAGRLFGLLSIQTLPRRLSLDFTDLFNKGFSFDSITGDFTMEQGHAYTNDLQMIGPAADIAVTGRTGFITEDYDQIATVTPKVSNSLPVASALFGPVGVGVGAVIYLTGELFKSIPDKIDQILRYQYSITGSWENPDIVKLDKDSDKG